MNLAIFGSSDLAKLIAHHAVNDQRWSIAGFFDNRREKGVMVDNYGCILGNADSILHHFNEKVFDHLIVGVGYTQFPYRKELFERFKGIIPFANLIHSSCFVDQSVILGEGIFLLPGCTVDCYVEIEDNVLFNTGCTIAHHSKIKKHSFMGPGVRVSGNVVVEECSFIGTGSTILDNLKIPPKSLIGGGSVVIDTLSSPGTYVGVPAKRISDNKYFNS